jgi:Rieske Fe-S protein
MTVAATAARHADGVYVAMAFKKWGMTHGTVAGILISDLIAGRDNPWVEVFDATRLAPKQSLKGVIAKNVHVLRRFVGDRIGTGGGATLDALEPGDGAVIRVDGETVAAFRDDDGTVRGVSAACTHLGCLVTFNSAERSWDCPCHGSRFATDGTVIEGPAVDDLDARDI